ncbi:MAG: cation:proton antiporter [Myxococcota bacterium]|nr:cation:proton antiporter [Myxococcota bacterium]
MRKVVVIATLLGLMLGMDALRVGGNALPGTLSLAAIGFVLLAAFTLGELGSRFRLPRVTGFVVTGVVLGPSLANILSALVVDQMRLFNTLALGLIALGAGLEMDLRSMRAVLRTLLPTIAVKVGLGIGLIAWTFYLVESSFHLIGLGSEAEVITMSLVLGVLSIGTSSAVALAIMKEERAKGRMMSLALNAAVLKDIVLIASLAAVIAIGRSQLGGTSDAQWSSGLGLFAWELGGSLVAGVLVGALLILYLRYVKAEMLLFVAAMILSTAEAGRLLHLELLLVFATAGFVVRNFSPKEEKLRTTLSLVSLPVFVVFFTTAGASLDLRHVVSVLPVALGLFLLRAGVYAIASNIGGRVGGETALIRRGAWLGYLPQAGLTLGLVTLAAQRLPEIGAQLLTLVMATMALNLLVGPITLRHILWRCGEAREKEEASSAPSDTAQETDTELQGGRAKLESRVSAIASAGEDPRLSATVRTMLHELDLVVDRVLESTLQPWSKALGQSVSLIVQAPQLEDEQRRLRSFAEQHRAMPEDERAILCHELFRELRGCLRRAPERFVVPLSQNLAKPQPTDPPKLKTRKRLAAVRRLFSGMRKPNRSIPLRLLWRFHFEPRCAALAARLFDLWYRTEAGILIDLGAFAARQSTAAETTKATASRLATITERWRLDIDAAWAGAIGELTNPLLLIDSPCFTQKAPRLADIEPAVRANLDRLAEDAQHWPVVRQAAYGELALRIGIAELDQRLTESLQASVLKPSGEALMAIEQIVSAARARLVDIISELPEPALELETSFCERLNAKLAATGDERDQRVLERAAARLRSASSAHILAMEARVSIEKLPQSLMLPRRATQIPLVQNPKELRLCKVAVQNRAHEILVEQMLPSIDSEVRGLTSTVALTSGRLRDAMDIGRHALSTAAAEAHPDPQLVRGAFERALHTLDEHIVALEGVIASAEHGITAAKRTAIDELLDMAASGESTSADLTGWIQRAALRARGTVRPMRTRLKELRQRVKETWGQLQDSQITQDVRRRVAAAGFDAKEIKDYLDGLSAPREIPLDYVKLFSLAPVREHRLAVAHEAQLRSIVATERTWLTAGSGSALLIGAHGSGRTSLLNLYELETSAPRLLRPDPLEWRREVGLVAAIAIELGVAPNALSVLAALAETPTTIMVDDLEQWFTPNLEGLSRLEKFLELIVASRDTAFWIISVEETAAALLSQAVGLEQAFSRVVRLRPLSSVELREAIERRHALSGRRMRFTTTSLSRLAARLRRTDEKAIYFELLAHISEGNLSRAYTLYLSSLNLDQEGSIHPHIHLTLRIALPFLRAIPAEVVGALVHLCRFGPMSNDELSTLLRSAPSLMRRHLSFLQASGLIEPLPTYPRLLRVPETVRPFVLQGLKELGVF